MKRSMKVGMMKATIAVLLVLMSSAILAGGEDGLMISKDGRFKTIEDEAANPGALNFRQEIQKTLELSQRVGPTVQVPVQVRAPEGAVAVNATNSTNTTSMNPINSTNSTNPADLNFTSNSTLPSISVDGPDQKIGSASGGSFKGFWGMEASQGGIGKSGIKSSTFLQGDFEVDKTIKFSDRI